MSFRIGQTVTGRVTGIQPYGAFVSLGDHRQGLIHISECHTGFVQDVHDFLSVDQEIDVVILDIDEFTQKISLSLRCLAHTPHDETSDMGDNSVHLKKHYWTNWHVNTGFNPIAERRQGWINEALTSLS